MAKRISESPAKWGKPRDAAPGVIAVLLALSVIGVASVATFQRYAFTDTFLFPLWYVALGVGILCGGLCFFKLMKEERSLAKRLGASLLVIVLVGFTAGSMLAHANHLFDSSEPLRFAVMIQDKEYRAGGRGPSHREFTVTARGETFEINVPRKDYNAFDVGDFYVIEYREGAFGEPYYLPVGGASENTDAP